VTDRAEYLRRAEEAERLAEELPPGFEREELLRNATAYRTIAELMEEQQERQGTD
jgi:hypothetical protein